MRKVLAALAVVIATPLMFASTASAAVHHHPSHHHAITIMWRTTSMGTRITTSVIITDYAAIAAAA